MYLYDTNVISELTKKKCDSELKKFVQTVSQSNQEVYLSVITIGEFEKGIKNLRLRNDHLQAQRLQDWYDINLPKISQNLLPFTEECSKVWGKLVAKNPHNAIDKQLVATALAHDLVLVTRNIKDIEDTGVRFVNPFG